MWDLIIFDCDGVLVDSEPIAHRALSDSLAEEGVVVDQNDFVNLFVGFSMATCIERAQNYSGKKISSAFAQSYYTRLYQVFKTDLKPIPFIHEALQQTSWPKCVASSGPHDKMQLTLRLTNLLEFFAGKIFSASDVSRGKPYPDLFLHAAAACKARPEKCVIVEDSIPGMVAGKAAGMTVFGYIPEDAIIDKEKIPSEAISFESMAQLPELLRAVKDNG